MSAPILAARALAVEYAGRIAVDHVDVSVRHAELVALVGLNGAGKSSLLAARAGLGPHTGSVLRCGCTDGQPTPGIAYLPQNPQLRTAFPLNAAQVVATGCLQARRWWRHPNAAQHAAAANAMATLGIAELAHQPSPSFPAAKPAACCWPVPWPRARRCCCSTSHTPDLMPMRAPP